MATVTNPSGDHETYNVAVSGMAGNGTVVAIIPADVCSGPAGNSNVASTSTTDSVTYDITPPTVTINNAAGQAGITNASPINFTAVFSQAVTNFTAAGVNLSGSTTGGTLVATVTNPSGDQQTFNVAVSGMAGNGTVVATIPAGVCSDAAGNSNVASTSTTDSVTYDVTPPTVTINNAASQAGITNVSPINFTAVFSQAVTNFTAAGVNLSGSTTGGTLVATVTNPSGDHETYNVAVSGMAGYGTVIATIPAGVCSDAAGNSNVASTSTTDSVTYETSPTVTVSVAAGQANPTTAPPINFTVVFSEPVTGFVTGEVSLGSSTTGGNWWAR